MGIHLEGKVAVKSLDDIVCNNTSDDCAFCHVSHFIFIMISCE